MIITKNALNDELRQYKNKNDKISRKIKAGSLYPIKRGLYSDDLKENKELISSFIIRPSYLSFQYALSKYQLIPDIAKVFTSAMCNMRKKKEYDTCFGQFIYYDVPVNIFRYGVRLVKVKDGSYFIATKEKALLDTLYKEKPLRTVKNLKEFLFDNMRIDEEDFYNLDRDDLLFLAERYNSTNCKLIKKIL